MSAICSLLKYRTDRHTSSGSVENTQLRLGSPPRDPFFDPSPPFFGFRPILWELLGYINEPNVVLSCSNKFFLILARRRGDNQL